MKFKLIKEVEGLVGAYGHENIKTGDVIELEGFFAEKARNNPDFAEVKTRRKKAVDNGDD